MTGNIAAVAIGGAIGAVLRHGVVSASRGLVPGLPVGTMIVNVVGCLLMGFLAVLLMERLPGVFGRFAPFLMTGVLGGFTTFSAFSLDALFLIERGRFMVAATYVIGSVVLSVAALWLGMVLARTTGSS